MGAVRIFYFPSTFSTFSALLYYYSKIDIIITSNIKTWPLFFACRVHTPLCYFLEVLYNGIIPLTIPKYYTLQKNSTWQNINKMSSFLRKLPRMPIVSNNVLCLNKAKNYMGCSRVNKNKDMYIYAQGWQL